MGKKNKQSFRNEWRTLTELGAEFGLSAVKFGKLLKEHGLRTDDGTPSEEAVTGSFCEKIQPKEGHSYYLWHQKRVSTYLVEKGVVKCGVSAVEASKLTEARKLARSYIEAQKLDEEGSKLGYMMLGEMVDEIQAVGLETFNQALKSVGYKGETVTLEGW